MDVLILPENLLEQVLAHCRAGYPNEACGILAGRGGRVEKVYTLTNADPSPVSYLIEPAEQFLAMKEMREKGLSMVGIFHSHPQSPAYPSERDAGLAYYDDASYLIVGLSDIDRPELRAYRISGGLVAETHIEITDSELH